MRKPRISLFDVQEYMIYAAKSTLTALEITHDSRVTLSNLSFSRHTVNEATLQQ